VSYSKPLVIDGARGPEILINTGTGPEAISADTGGIAERIVEDNRFPIPVATLAEGMIYTTRGVSIGADTGDSRGRSGRRHGHATSAWRVPTGAPYISSLVLYQGLIYTAGELGVVTCSTRKPVERVWQNAPAASSPRHPLRATPPLSRLGKRRDGSAQGRADIRGARATTRSIRTSLPRRRSHAEGFSVRGDNELFAVGK
jgi:hypothetical protein